VPSGSSSTPITLPRKGASLAVAALGLALLVAAYVSVRPYGPLGPAMRDFEAFYAAGVVANEGGDPYGRTIWDAERTIPGVDVSHNETLPFVGPRAGLPLWRALARLPYDVAGRVWGVVLAAALLTVVFGGLALAKAPREPAVLVGATIFAGAYGAVISDVSLGQLALLSAAAIVGGLLLLRTRVWILASLAAAIAALQPNVALALIASATDARALAAFAAGVVLFAVPVLAGGVTGFLGYLHLLAAHGASEAATVIQITPAGVAIGLGAGGATVTFVRVAAAAGTLALMLPAIRRIRDPVACVALASCALPFIVPFFHEHDFVPTLLPATLCALRARSATLGLAAVGATASGVDWLGLGQRPPSEVQSILLAFACALGFALVARMRREAFAALIVPVAVAGVSVLARAHPVAVWPDALPPHWQPPPEANVSAVWGLEQRAAGLDAHNAVWSLLRVLSLASVALLGLATFASARSTIDVQVAERRGDVRAKGLGGSSFAGLVSGPAATATHPRRGRVYARIVAGSRPWRRQNSSYASGEISDGLISLRPPQKTLV
jgi:hypothetical protein